MRTNALTSYVPLCRRWTKKGKALSKNANIGWKCGKYHSTIKVMNSHKRRCDECEDKSDDEVLEEDEDEDKENEEDHIEVEFTGDDEAYEVIYFYGGGGLRNITKIH